MGRTLTHEHLSMQFDVCFVPSVNNKNLETCEWTLENVGAIQQEPYSHRDNIVINDKASEAAILKSVAAFKAAGGGCLVENSTRGLRRKSGFMARVAQETGIHVVAGTGYYVAPSQAPDPDRLLNHKDFKIEAMSDLMMSELNEGCFDDRSVQCGFIGEIGCSWPLHELERRAIRAAAQVQEAEKCAVSFHPGRKSESPDEIMRIFLEAGGKAEKTIMSHLESK